MALSLRYATLAQLGAMFRIRFQKSKGAETARLSKWLLARIADATFTEAQVRNFFNLTVPQWTALKTKLETLVLNHDQVTAAQGE